MQQVRVVTVGELLQLAIEAERDPDSYPVLPIDRRRAHAHAANPLAGADDPALILLLADGKCLGYMGVLVQEVSVAGERRRYLAVTTLYLDPTLRGSGAARLMLDSARGLGCDLYSVGNSRRAHKFFERNGATALPPFHIHYLRLGASVALTAGVQRFHHFFRRRKFMRLASGASRVEDVLLAGLSPYLAHSASRLCSRLHPSDTGWILRPVAALPRGVADVDVRQTRVAWTAPTLNWMMAHPWVGTEEADPRCLARRFHFAQSFGDYRHFAYELETDGGAPEGFAMFQLHMRRGHRTIAVLQYALPDARARTLLLQEALQLAVRHRATQISCGPEFAPELAPVRDDCTQEERVSFCWPLARASMFRVDGAPFAETYSDGDIAYY